MRADIGRIDEVAPVRHLLIESFAGWGSALGLMHRGRFGGLRERCGAVGSHVFRSVDHVASPLGVAFVA